MRFRCLGLLLSIAVALLGIASTAAAAGSGAGRLDRSFGQGGGAVFPPVSPNQIGQDMALGSGDEIFVLQQSIGCLSTGSTSLCTPHIFVERFTPDGALDPSFGSAGVSDVVALGGEHSFGSPGSLAIAPDGGLVAATTVSGSDMNLVRFDQSGRLDKGFGSGGVVISDFGGIERHPQVAVQPDGKILLSAESALGPQGDRFTVVSRYLPNGAVDTSFGAGAPGAAAPGALAVGGLIPGAIAISNSGQIALGLNRGCCVAHSKVFAGRRDANGQLQPGFASGSPWRRFSVGQEALVSSVVALPNGKIYLVGTTESGAYALKLLPSGRPDRGFGKSGVVQMNAIGRAPVALVDDAGRLVVAGSRVGDSEFEPAPLEGLVVRRMPNGRPDQGWAGGKPARLSSAGPPSARVNVPLAIGVQSSGDLVLLGEWVYECSRSCRAPGTGMLRLRSGR